MARDVPPAIARPGGEATQLEGARGSVLVERVRSSPLFRHRRADEQESSGASTVVRRFPESVRHSRGERRASLSPKALDRHLCPRPLVPRERSGATHDPVVVKAQAGAARYAPPERSGRTPDRMLGPGRMRSRRDPRPARSQKAFGSSCATPVPDEEQSSTSVRQRNPHVGDCRYLEFSMTAIGGGVGMLTALGRLGFDEVSVDPPWADLGEARSVIAACLDTVG
jgi:hypothetical protein